MHAQVFSATTIGVDAQLIEVEADLSNGIARFMIVGLPDKAVNESKERVRAAVTNSGCRFPVRAITVNLAPANLRKQDVLFDVPIALALLQATGEMAMSASFMDETVFVGELALNGDIRSVCGVLSIADYACAQGKKRIIVPQHNAEEAALIKGIEVVGVKNLAQLVAYLAGEIAIVPTPLQFSQYHSYAQSAVTHEDMADIAGQWQAKRAIVLAAAGHHNVVMIGAPGAGKTMLARRLCTLLAPLSFQQIINVTKVYSVAGQLREQRLVTQRPFRAPHHTISSAGLIGGGSVPRPGEVSLSHHGVLFLDELTEFSRKTLEVLRQPLESGDVRISRAAQSVCFPADFLLVAALNPCPCGYYGQKNKCECRPQRIKAYLEKLSGPLLDRIDLHVSVRTVAYQELQAKKEEKRASSAELAAQVAAVQQRQYARGQTVLNGQLSGKQILTVCALTSAAQKVIATSFDRLGLSMRGYHKVLKVARTIADLAGCGEIDAAHIQEALGFRLLER